MAQVIGLSHLVFTTNAKELSSGSSLSALYRFAERNHYGPIPEKRSLLRNPEGWRSTSMSLYHSQTASHPSFELIHASSGFVRPLGSYGLILPVQDGGFPDPIPVELSYLRSALSVDNVVLDETVPTYIIFSSTLAEHNCTMGAWLEVADLHAATALYKDILMAEELWSGDGLTVLKCRVINKKFSSFLWVLRNKTDEAAVYYNDDCGLSTIGWIARGLDGFDEAASLHGLQASGHFGVTVGGRDLKAAFLFDNRSASHELLSV